MPKKSNKHDTVEKRVFVDKTRTFELILALYTTGLTVFLNSLKWSIFFLNTVQKLLSPKIKNSFSIIKQMKPFL